MSEKIVMPKLGMTMTEGTIEEWYKEVGDSVEKGEPILTISSEKLTQEVEAPSSGVLLSQNVSASEEAKVGDVIGIIGEVGGNVSEAFREDKEEVLEERLEEESHEQEQEGDSRVAKASSTKRSRIFITPLARKMAQDKAFDIELIKGTGGNGRITKLDIQRIEERGYDYESDKQLEKSAKPSMMNAETIGKGLSSMRKVIARNMRESLANSAQLTLH